MNIINICFGPFVFHSFMYIYTYLNIRIYLKEDYDQISKALLL